MEKKIESISELIKYIEKEARKRIENKSREPIARSLSSIRDEED